jgi:hypothetical protein
VAGATAVAGIPAESGPLKCPRVVTIHWTKVKKDEKGFKVAAEKLKFRRQVSWMEVSLKS